MLKTFGLLISHVKKKIMQYSIYNSFLSAETSALQSLLMYSIQHKLKNKYKIYVGNV